MILIVVLGLSVLPACSVLTPHRDTTAELHVHFVCTNGEAIEMRFFPAPRSGAVLIRKDTPIELPRQPAASGFLYSDGPNTVRGKGDEITVEIGRMVPFDCKVSDAAR